MVTMQILTINSNISSVEIINHLQDVKNVQSDKYIKLNAAYVYQSEHVNNLFFSSLSISIFLTI